MGMTPEQKIEKAKSLGIDIPKEILEKDMAGVYKFYYYKQEDDDDKGYFYVGKASNIAYRLLDSSGGHIHLYLYNYLDNKLVPTLIDEYIKNGYQIKVEVQEVDYEDSSFSRAAHKLALAELQEIVRLQEEGQCLVQRPEGVGKKEEYYWDRKYKKFSYI